MPTPRATAGALVAGLALALAGPGPLTAAHADTADLPGTLSTALDQTGPLGVVVPPGVTPSALTGVLTMPEVVPGGQVLVLLNGRTAATIPSTLYTRFVVPLGAADVVADGTVGVSLRWAPPAGTDPCAPPPAITVRRLQLEHTGSETPPTSTAAFLPAQAPRIDVRVPPDADDDVLAAGLAAVAALSARYPADTEVALGSTDEPLPSYGAGQRAVVLTSTGGPVRTSLSGDAGVPTLTIDGTGADLARAAGALGSDQLALADGSSTGALGGAEVARDTSLTRTLDELRAQSPAPLVQAPGTTQVELLQDAFGQPVSAVRVHLEGTHTAVPADVEARVDVYLGQTLVGSEALGTETAFDLDLTLPGTEQTSGLLRVVLRSTPAGGTPTDPTDPTDATGDVGATADPAPGGDVATTAGACTGGLPLELALDGTRTTVTGVAGLGDRTGFALLPQVLRGTLPVALPEDGDRVAAAEQAAVLVSALQRQAAEPLRVELTPTADLVAGDRSGLVVGARGEVEGLQPPLALSSTRALDSSTTRFAVDSGQPFAALEAVVDDDRVVLLLGSWAPDGDAPARLTRRLLERVTGAGWSSLVGDVLVSDASPTPYLVDSGARAAAATQVEEEPAGSPVLALLAVALGLVLVALGALAVLARRREQRPRAGAPTAFDRLISTPPPGRDDEVSRGPQPPRP